MANNITVPFVMVPGIPGPGAFSAAADLVPAASPFQGVSGQLVPCDVRAGPVTVQFPVGPTDGALFAVSDIYGLSSVNPVRLVAEGVGVTIADPSSPGPGTTYGAVASLSGQLPQVTWRYSASSQQWRFN